MINLDALLFFLVVAVLSLLVLNLILVGVYFGIEVFLLLKSVGISNWIKKFKEKIAELKKKSITYFIKLQNLKFHHYVDICNIFFLIILYFCKVDKFYIFIYIPFYLVTRAFIYIMKHIIVMAKKKKITEFWLFMYIGFFVLLICGYIASFAPFYSYGTFLGQGSFVTPDGSFYRIKGIESLSYSAFTFFSMEYHGLQPRDLMSFFTIAEVFISQILLITFIGVMASEIIAKLELKGMEEGKNENE